MPAGSPNHDEPELFANVALQERVTNGVEKRYSFADSEGEAEPNGVDLGVGDYSQQLDEILSEDGEPGTRERDGIFEEEEEEDEGFFYSGVDSTANQGYKERMKDVLESDAEPEEEELAPQQELDRNSEEGEFSYEQLSREVGSPSQTGKPKQLTPLKRPFLHPSVSRLRSITPRNSTYGSEISGSLASPPPSHLTFSRASSVSDLKLRSDNVLKSREAFKWSSLHSINDDIFQRLEQGADSHIDHGQPTTMAANGLICVGTTFGRVLVYDFKQKLKCVCGNSPAALEQGPVTAVALTQDRTFIAVGHESGHIFLYNISKPHSPARSVPTTTLQAVASGRREGHLANVPINKIGFVGKRHTAIVSSDENGLAFYHSLGKALFFDAVDVLRILGKYPEKETPKVTEPKGSTRRKGSTILGMSPLPLGAFPDSIDDYNLVALITPVKLIIAGLKPSPRTWHRQHRNSDGLHPEVRSKWRGCLAWYPRVIAEEDELNATTGPAASKVQGTQHRKTDPTLVYSWGSSAVVLRAREQKITSTVKNPKTGKDQLVITGKVLFDEQVRWSADNDLLALQWLTSNLVLGVTVDAFTVWDVSTGACVERSPYDVPLVSLPFQAPDQDRKAIEPSADVSQSVRVYKGKMFLLTQDGLKAGALLSWADRLLSLVQQGHYLSAVDLCRMYYTGEAPGNRIGLPSNKQKAQLVIESKLKDLMTASANYAFSEERLVDETHVTADGRGVDRTALFEGMVASFVMACVALGNLDLLYEDLFEKYNSWGITRIFVSSLEPFILDNGVDFVPPRITKELVALHDEKNQLEAVEKLIWHIDPQCLDIDQAIHLCKRHELWDAMLYVYTAALHDYVSPVVELLELIRKVQQQRIQSIASEELVDSQGELLDRLASASYKVFSYLSNILSGLTYPGQAPMPASEAVKAKSELYAFLFYGRSTAWSKGQGGQRLLATLDQDGQPAAYPYLRLLLHFDAEACLHTLDIAFEDSFLNDRSHNVSRLVIVKVLLELRDSEDFSAADVTFVNIFVARNVPKYPQYLDLVSQGALNGVLVGLIEDPDLGTREDRQMAAEYLLSVYAPRRTESLIASLHRAKFFRILRSWYRQEHKWQDLFKTYVDDIDLSPEDVFSSVSMVLNSNQRDTRHKEDLSSTFDEALPQFLTSSVTKTAQLVDNFFPIMHEHVLDQLTGADHKQLAYLKSLLEPDLMQEQETSFPNNRHRSTKLTDDNLLFYVQLLTRQEPDGVIRAFKNVIPRQYDWGRLETLCEGAGVFHACIWSIGTRGDHVAAFRQVKRFTGRLARQILDDMGSSWVEHSDITSHLLSLQHIRNVAIELCQQSAEASSVQGLMPPEDMWLATLSSQIDAVQIISRRSETESSYQSIIEELKESVQHTFLALMSLGTASSVKFSHLFKLLVDVTAPTRSMDDPSYSQFRSILGGILDAYRFEEDVLLSGNRLLAMDLVEAIQDREKARNRGWMCLSSYCKHCQLPVSPSSSALETEPSSLTLSRTGDIFHHHCLTSRNK